MIGFDDSLILMVLALVVFGPRRLPEIGRKLGKLMYEFRKASNDFKFQMEEELRMADEADRRKQEGTRQQQLAQQAPQHTAAAEAADQTQKALPAASEAAGSESTYGESSYPYENYGGGYAEPEGQATRGEESTLRVEPPATGEPVAAERPGRAPAQDEAAQKPALAAGAGSGEWGGESSDGEAGEGSGFGAADTAAAGAVEIPVEKETTAAAAGAVTEPAGHYD